MWQLSVMISSRVQKCMPTSWNQLTKKFARPRTNHGERSLREIRMANAIEVKSLRKIFAGTNGAKTEVLRGVDFNVRKGEIFALLGSNGAGKTTTINILSTLLKPDSGSASVCGFDVARQSEKVRESIS